MPNDHFNVFVIDGNTLQSIHFLDFFNDVRGQLFNAFELKYVCRNWRTVDDLLAAFDRFTVKDHECPSLANQLLVFLTFLISNDQPDFSFRFLAETDRPGMPGINGRFLGSSGLEQFRNTRQATGNVSSRVILMRNSCQHIPHLNFVIMLHEDLRASRQQISNFTICLGEHDGLIVFVNQSNRRPIFDQLLLGIKDRIERAPFGTLVIHVISRLRNRNPVYDIFKLDDSTHFVNDRMHVWVPTRNGLIRQHRGILLNVQLGTIRHLVAFGHNSVCIKNFDFTGTGVDDKVATGIFDVVNPVKL